MTHLELARLQMACSLGFHIIFASISMVMPFLMFLAYRKYLKERNPIDLKLTKAWMKGSAILFATGAVSGTALSFQLGLLWPTFMEHAGPIFGMPFSLEGAAFFLEAIFLGLFLYGWNRIPEKLHLFFGFMVGACGLASGALVIAANGWMNAPTGFDWVNGKAENIDPIAAMFNKAWPLQAVHMLVAAFQATTTAAMGLHAFGLLKNPASGLHKRAFKYLIPLFCVAALVQPLVGDLIGKSVAERQPEKLAAMEALFETQERAPLLIGGIPDPETKTVKYGIEIPGGLSFLVHSNFTDEVKGLDAFPEDEHPPVVITHLSFQVMVGLGMTMVMMALVYIFAKWKKINLIEKKWWLKLLMVCTPIGFIALEAGWIVTEVGRQPWIIYKVMRTEDAVTPVPGLEVSLIIILVLYTFLSIMSFYLLFRLFKKSSEEEE
ncbi:MAG: cytochrome ubiquinol oxidase subunit I [Lentisphaeria bacterium]|nr:cytochrome ubiquinol oxidase subunit I [Lentisphaeria bacterium]